MKSRKGIAALVCALVFAAGLSFSAGAAPPQYMTMHVFGDSLADMGNVFSLKEGAVPPPGTYFQGRFSNGPVFPEVLWWMLSQNPPGSKKALKLARSTAKLTGNDSVNFAFGGAGTGQSTVTPGGFRVPGLKGQVKIFLEMAQANGLAKKALYLIVVGSNDYLFPQPDVPDVATVVGNIAASIRSLYAAGGRDFMVLNVPDLGMVPLAPLIMSPVPLDQVSAAHNAALAVALTNLAAELTGARIIPIDLAVVMQAVPPELNLLTPALDHPTVSTCLFVNFTTCPVVGSFDAPTSFFWDALHPTTVVHQLLGRFLFDVLQQQ